MSNKTFITVMFGVFVIGAVTILGIAAFSPAKKAEHKKTTDEAWADLVYDNSGKLVDSWHNLKVDDNYSIKGDDGEVYYFRIARIDLGNKSAVIVAGPPPTEGDQSKGELGFGTYTLKGTRSVKLDRLEELIKTRSTSR